MGNTDILFLPGVGGSGPDHWQTMWQQALPNARTVQQLDWQHPDLQTWLCVLDHEIGKCRNPILLVPHSLGCALLAHWAERVSSGRIGAPGAPLLGAMLVAPGDVDRFAPELDAVRSFAPMPQRKFSFPSVVVASTDDPFVSADRAAQFAEWWGSEFISLGPMGHIAAADGCGPWPRGRRILRAFAEEQLSALKFGATSS